MTEPSIAVRLEDRLRLLMDTGLLLRAEREPDLLLQTALDAGRTLSQADYAVLYSRIGMGNPDTYRLDRVSGGAPPFFQSLLQPPLASFLASAASATEIARIADIQADPAFAGEQYRLASGQGALRVRSLMVVPVRRRKGELLSAAVFGDFKPDAFSAESGSLAFAVLNQAVCLLDNLELEQRRSAEAARADAAGAKCREAERRLHQALDTNQLGTWKWEAEADLLYLDERGAELFGVPPHQPLSRVQLRDHLVFREDLSRVPEDLSTVLATGGKYEAEYRIKDRDGNLRWVASIGLPSADETTGKVTSMTGTVQDITVRKLQEESLRQSEKLAATGRMAATIAHEINNPLEAVTNLIYLAKTDPGSNPTVQRLLETADSELARVSQIAQQTLGFYRDTTRPVNIDLNVLLAAVVDLFGRRCAGKRLQISLDLDPGLTMVGLQGEIRQVVSNLLINAIDASDTDGGPIRIRGRHRCRNGCHGVSVVISDQGSGIPKHVRKRLFTPFVTTKESRGTGLGLWVTRGMIEKHGGSVRFRSCTDSPSTGTVFRVFFPKSVSAQAFASPGSSVLQ